MEPTMSGPTTGFVLSAVVWAEVRHILELLIWVLVVAFATAAGAWCCGYAMREAWLKAGPPARRPRPRRAAPSRQAVDDAPDEAPADEIALEAATGILEIERYLADVSAGGSPTRPERDPDS